MAAAGAFLERSVALTADPTRRIARSLGAAEAFQQSGRLEAASRLAAEAEAVAADDAARSEVALLRGRIAYAAGEGAHAPRLLFHAAQQLEYVDADRARQTYLTALIYACFAGNLADGVDIAQIARAARLAPRAESSSRALDLLLDGFAALAVDGPAAAAPLLQQAIARFPAPETTAPEDVRWLGAVCPAASVIWDDEGWHRLVTAYIAAMRKAGALTYLTSSLNGMAHVLLMEGKLEAASTCINEASAINEVSGSHYAPYVATYLAALRGQADEAMRLVERTIDDALANGQGVGWQFARSATATLWNGLGRYAEALDAARQASEHPPDWSSHLALHEMIEAAVRCDDRASALEALARLVESTSACATDWSLGVEARSRALVAGDDDSADALYREAIERLSRTRVRTELARAHLLYGEWLRRANRRSDAREQLRTAHDMLSDMGIEGFAERAGRELQATGETVRKRRVDTYDELTPQEACIARLAADGLTNPEIGIQLYISARTVEYHLRKIFTKLGVSSRRELRGVMPVVARH
jgi:DNA-binding CsgD family transcriptional regulator/tetratricopeptide (TPR) repeat protein